MSSLHAKRMRISAAAFKRLSGILQEHKYSAKRREGFIVDEATPNRLSGRYYFIKVQKTKSTNPDTLEEEVKEEPVMVSTRFAANLTSGTILVRDRRSDLNVLEDVFNAMPGISVLFEDYSTDVVELYKALRDGQGRVDIRALRIKDYLGREGLLTNANFKLMQPEHEDAIFMKYQSDTQAITMNIIIDGKRQNLTVTRGGSIRHSDEMPLDIVEMTLNFLPQFHEDEVSMQTVEV